MALADFRYQAFKSDMNKGQIYEAILERRQWIEDNEAGLADGVKSVLNSLLDYVAANFLSFDNDFNEYRYSVINQILSLSVQSTQSGEAEKLFYRQTNHLLEQDSYIVKQISSVIKPVVKDQQLYHMSQLERLDPDYKNAVNGMAVSFFEFGLILSMLDGNPLWYILCSMFVMARFLPSQLSIDSHCLGKPSILGELVYKNDNLRELGNTLHNTVSAYGLSQQVLGFFDRERDGNGNSSSADQNRTGLSSR